MIGFTAKQQPLTLILQQIPNYFTYIVRCAFFLWPISLFLFTRDNLSPSFSACKYLTKHKREKKLNQLQPLRRITPHAQPPGQRIVPIA